MWKEEMHLSFEQRIYSDQISWNQIYLHNWSIISENPILVTVEALE